MKPLNIVISGIFSLGKYAEDHGRNELRAAIKAAGHNVRSEVNSKTDYLVVWDVRNWFAFNVGPAKMAKAQELGIPVVSLNEFKQIVAI